MLKKFFYYLFDSENEDLNSQCRHQMKILDSNQSVIEFFKLLN